MKQPLANHPSACLLTLIVLLISFFTSQPALAGKLYKIVDAEGNVTFSQYPPAEQEEDAKIQSLDQPGTGATSVTEKYGAKYCGEKRLPSYGNYNRDVMLKNLDNFRKNAEHKLKYQEEKLERLNKYDQRTYENDKKRREHAQQYRNSYLNNAEYKRKQDKYSSQARQQNRQKREQILRELRDLRCQVNWADGYRDEIFAMKSEANQNAARLKETSDRINSEMLQNCGSEPHYDPSDETSAAIWRRWKECVRKYKKDLYHVDRRLYNEQYKAR